MLESHTSYPTQQKENKKEYSSWRLKRTTQYQAYSKYSAIVP